MYVNFGPLNLVTTKIDQRTKHMRKRAYSSEPKSQMKSTFTTKLIHAYLSHDQYPNLLADDPSATIEFAYEIQKEFVNQIDDEPIGYKAAVTAEPMQKMMGIEAPISGVLFKSGDYSNRTNIKSARELLIETELGFETGVAITDPVKPKEVYALIECFYPMIELASPNLTSRPSGIDLVASNSASFGFIKGNRFDCNAIDPDSIDVSLNHEGTNLHSNRCNNVMSGQASALSWLINQIISQYGVVESGSLLMSGSVGPAHPGRSGKYNAKFEKLGEINFAIE